MAQQVKVLVIKSDLRVPHSRKNHGTCMCMHMHNKCNFKILLRVVAHTCNPRMKEAEAGMSPTHSRAARAL